MAYTIHFIIYYIVFLYFAYKTTCQAIPSYSQLPKHTYRLAWEDDFNSKTLDSTKWSKIVRVPWPWGCHMSDNDELYELKSGRLRLYCKLNIGIAPNDTAPYLTGGISSQHKPTIGFDNVKVRVKS